MFCPFCGLKTEDSNQKFCINCGNEFSYDFEIPKPTSINTISVIPQKEVKSNETSRPYSKKCLVFAVISLVLVCYQNLSWYLIDSITFITAIMYLIVNCVGSIFGFISRTYSKKARNLEPENIFETSGSIIAIIGIVVNTFLVISGVIDIISYFFPRPQPTPTRYF